MEESSSRAYEMEKIVAVGDAPTRSALFTFAAQPRGSKVALLELADFLIDARLRLSLIGVPENLEQILIDVRGLAVRIDRMVDGDHGFHGLVDIREVAGTHRAEYCRAQDGAFPIAQCPIPKGLDFADTRDFLPCTGKPSRPATFFGQCILEGENCLPEIMLDRSWLLLGQKRNQPPEGCICYTGFALLAGVRDPHPELFRVLAAFDERENFCVIFQLPVPSDAAEITTARPQQRNQSLDLA